MTDESIRDWYERRGTGRTPSGRVYDLVDLVEHLAEGRIFEREEDEDLPNARRKAAYKGVRFCTGSPELEA